MDISKGNDLIDSRDLLELFEDLKTQFVDEFNEWAEENEHEPIEDWEDAPTNLEDLEDLHQEITELADFINECAGYGDFDYGEALIHEDYFTEYCEDFLKDCGYIPNDMPSWIELDFEATAENMKADYITADWGDETYYMRA